MSKKIAPSVEVVEVESVDEPVVEIAEPAVEPLKAPARVIGSYKLVEGDSWASVAGKHPLAGMTKHVRALDLAARYGEAVAGKVIEV
jgi:hypothetical protein